MFHVKHFRPIAAKNLTKLTTATRPQFGKINQNFGAIGIGRRQRANNSACGRKTSAM